MKKILFAAHSLGLGGIETALITLLGELVKKEYDITLVLEKKEGIFLHTLDPKIKIIEYCPNKNKIVLIRKFINMCKQIKFKIRYKNKFDFAAAYATYSLSSGFVARVASKNSALWVHLDYLTQNQNNEEKARNYYKQLKCDQYKNIIFVSKEARDNFLKLFPEICEKAIYCNNLIDGASIIAKSEQEVKKEDLQKINKKDETIFLNIGRHDERQKKLTRLIDATQMLKKDNLKFKVIFVGDGQDSTFYKEKVKKANLEDKIIFLGKKQNPYPYYKISDCVVLTSDYEGYPVVFLESMILKVPLITTKVSDYQEVENKFGLVTTKETQDIYEKMKQFIEKRFEIKEEFDYKKYNEEIIKTIEQIINGN